MRRFLEATLVPGAAGVAIACSSSEQQAPWPTTGAAGTAADASGQEAGAGAFGGEAGASGTGGTSGTGASGGAAGPDAGGSGGTGPCEPGTADCNGNPTDGCEVTLDHDPSNCGSCGTVCSAPAHAVSICTANVCGFECMPTHGDCDHDPDNGCEVTFGNDVHNCGTCGHECTATGTDKPTCVGAVCGTCPVIQFSIQTMQACAISLPPGFDLDAEAFIQVGGTDHRVLAIDRWGSGHIIGWCDGTTTHTLLDSFDVLRYLGQTTSPKVASVGDQYLCKPGAVSQLPSSITWLGEDLPASYHQNAVQLAADWDVLIFCGFRIPWSTDWSAEISSFVSDHGKGLLAVMEYEGVAQPQDFQNMTNITDGAGIVFEPLNLPWAPASADVLLDCVPDLD